MFTFVASDLNKELYSFIFFILHRFWYNYIHCRKFNAKFTMQIRTLANWARYFEKWCWTIAKKCHLLFDTYS